MYRRRRPMKKGRKAYRKRRGGAVRRLNSPSQGYLNISRKIDVLSIKAGENAGTVAITDPTGTCLAVGVPTPSPGAVVGTYDVPFSLKFRLDQLTNYTEFTNLFDSYKLNGVKVLMSQFYNTSSVTSIGLPWIEHFNDHDNSIPETVFQVRQRMGVKTKYYSATKQVVAMYVKPKVQQAVFSNVASGITFGVSPRQSQWLDCAQPGIEHYAIKGIIHNMWLGNANLNNFQLDVSVNVSLKGAI